MKRSAGGAGIFFLPLENLSKRARAPRERKRTRRRGHERADGSDFVGGMSGGLFNNDLVTELRAVRSDESFSRRVAFAYLDGHQYADRMKSLGLFGGAEFSTNK